MAYTAPRTWVADETLTAALLNQHLRDQLNAAFPVGSLHFFMQAATTAATTIEGFALECNGTAVSRATYAALNTKLSGLSYPFGSGDGSTTMNLPDLQGRGLVAMASGGHADVNGLGDADGLAKASRTPKWSVAAHTHTGPSHTHTGPSHTHTFSATTADNSGSFTADGGAGQLGNDHTHNVSGTTGAGGTGTTGAGGTGTTGGGGGGSGSGNFLVVGVVGVKY